MAAATSCGTQAQAEDSADGKDSGLLVLASTDVYASLAQEIVGNTADVEAIVDSPAMDPHSYEATPQDRLKVEEADVLIANGGGYDPFITQLADAAKKADAVYQLISGENWHSHEFDGNYENEHIWFDLSRMSEFVTDFGHHMGERTTGNAELYAQNAKNLAERIDELDDRNRSIAADGLSYSATEPVSGFLLQDAGFQDLTDDEFLSAVEHGDDVSPRLFSESLDLITTGEVDLLSYNMQTETNQSLRIREAAEENSVAILEFSETLPEAGISYTEWMESAIEDVEDVAGSLSR